MYTVVTEAQKECTCAAYALAKLLQKANSGSNWRNIISHTPKSQRDINNNEQKAAY